MLKSIRQNMRLAANTGAGMIAGYNTPHGFWHEHKCIDLRDLLEGMAIHYWRQPPRKCGI